MAGPRIPGIIIRGRASVVTGSSEPSLLRFGVFDLDPKSGELRKGGVEINLPPQPAKVLVLLATRAGQLVTREELRQQVWGKETFVDFEHGLNSCIKQIRAALDDHPDAPRYFENRPRRTYRFIAPVQEVSRRVGTAGALSEGLSSTAQRSGARRFGIAAVGVVAILIATGYFARLAFPRHAVLPADKIMLAVLPFENLTGDTRQEYLSDGLTEEMITQLGRMHPERLGVIARTSAMQYKKTQKGMDQIGRELGVAYVLEGSLRRAGDHVRVSAQLIQVRDQTHLWAESYERDLRDLLALQSGLAEAHTSLAFVQMHFDWDWPAAEREFTRALQLNPGYPTAHHWYAFWLLAHGRAEEALQEVRAAQRLDPLSLIINTDVGEMLYYGRRHDEAIEQGRRALEIDSTFALAHRVLGLAYLAKRQFAPAIEELGTTARLSGGQLDLVAVLGLAYAEAGRTAEARKLLKTLEQASQQRPDL